MLRSLANRLYADFLMPSRLGQYRAILARAAALGYECLSIESFWQAQRLAAAGDRRQLVLRHDIDTDAATARKLFAIEREMGVKASYYFRLSTVDLDLMRELNAGGWEASYHFEEIATVAKEKRLRTRDQVLAHLPEIQQRFLGNLTALRRDTGLPMHVVAAHGDFVNRRLGMPNQELLDERVRKEGGVDLEVYDPVFMDNVSAYFSDTSSPAYWKPSDPLVALERGDRVVCMLTHPRHWAVNRPVNLADDVRRAWEGLRYNSGEA